MWKFPNPKMCRMSPFLLITLLSPYSTPKTFFAHASRRPKPKLSYKALAARFSRPFLTLNSTRFTVGRFLATFSRKCSMSARAPRPGVGARVGWRATRPPWWRRLFEHRRSNSRCSSCPSRCCPLPAASYCWGHFSWSREWKVFRRMDHVPLTASSDRRLKNGIFKGNKRKFLNSRQNKCSFY